MKKITCDYCFEDHFFKYDEDRPESCKNCHSPLGHLVPEGEKEPQKDFTGIRLKYRKTGEEVIIPHSEIVILGRHNTGKEVLEKIPQISREHCKIEFLDGKYKITDLNSLNGTFLGSTRRDCLKYPNQEIRERDVLFLGREEFEVRVRIPEEVLSASASEETEGDEMLKFKCRACGKIHDMNLAICDSCGSYGQIEPLGI